MTRSPRTVPAAVLLGAAAALLAIGACSDDAEPEAAAGTSGEAGSETSGNTGQGGDGSGSNDVDAGAGGAERGGSAAAAAGEASTGKGGARDGAGGTPVEAGAGTSAIEPPGPAPGGGSVYAVECSGDTAMCGVEGAHCLGVNTGSETGYSCSNRCNTVDDCSDAPSGAEAAAGCVQFKQEKRCVLVCYDEPNESACPDGMDCYIYPNSPIGYCLWMK